ncbi:PhzF family phenazine biosynthesis isomerase [Nocardiopsis coralliicola]
MLSDGLQQTGGMSTHATPTLHVLMVFLGGDAAAPTGGNPLGVLTGAPPLAAGVRQSIAAELGYSETVFLEDAATGRLRIHTPAVELPLAGHPLVGTAWLLHRDGAAVDTLRPPAGDIPVWRDGDRTWIRADPGDAPVFEQRQLDSAADVEAYPGGEEGVNLEVWAWEDEAAGRVRARVFPHGMGIAEDEATGAAALRLGARLGRPLVIRQGAGSRIDVRPAPGGKVDVGGRAAETEVRPYLVPESADEAP